MRHFLLSLLLFANPLSAEELVPPSEFENLSTGKSMYFFQRGQYYGAEQFFKNRLATWQYREGQCVMGSWRPKDDAICFTYENNATEQCWKMYRQEDGRLTVRSEGGNPEDDLELRSVSDGNLSCPGPSVGA